MTTLPYRRLELLPTSSSTQTQDDQEGEDAHEVLNQEEEAFSLLQHLST